MVEEIFRERIHRDVVFHSGKLLQFVCGMEDKLTPEHVDLIWSSCVKEPSAELQVRADERKVDGGRIAAVFLRASTRLFAILSRLFCTWF